MKLNKSFFERSADVVARELLGKFLVRVIGDERFYFKIVETEAYFGSDDPASRAYKGKNKISEMMFEDAGKILVYNVHMYKMFNVVTDKFGVPSAVLIRALEPQNFSRKNLWSGESEQNEKSIINSYIKFRCSGPGLLTNSLNIDKSIHGKCICELDSVWIEEGEVVEEIAESNRIGVTKDLEIPMRFYVKGNKFVSRK